MLYLINPARRGRMAKRRKGKTRTAAQRRATARLVAANKRRRKGRKKSAIKRTAVAPRRKRSRKATSTGRKVMARKRTRSRKRGRRRSSASSIRFRRIKGQVYSRNPGILGLVKQGVKDTAFVLGGGAAARAARGILPLPQGGVIGAAAGVAIAIGLGMLSRKFLGSDAARFVVAGAMQPAIKDAIMTVSPSIGGMLGEYDDVGYLDAGDSMGSYVDQGMSSYEVV